MESSAEVSGNPMQCSGNAPSTTQYAELHCVSNFSFLRGASHPDELVRKAAELQYSGLALTDECSVAGVVRAHAAAKNISSLKLVIGSEFECSDALKVVVLAANRHAYSALCGLISRARRAAPKGTYQTSREDLVELLAGSQCPLLWVPTRDAENLRAGRWLKEHFDDRVWLAVELLNDGNDRQWLARSRDAGMKLGLPLVASGNVHMHSRERRMLQDTLTAIRLKLPVDKLGFALQPNAERSLRSLDELGRKYPPELLKETLAILERIDFSLSELRYEYPHEVVPEGQTSSGHLRLLTEQGKRWRWPAGAPDKVLSLIENELELIKDLGYEHYFLTVYDIVNYARSQKILCQGRGSAANSVVCYCLGITEVNPDRTATLVGRFISKERHEPPDIDVDFEHERREEVIQYIYTKYSRERAALAATVITYRPRSALRDVGRALGLNELQVNALAKSLQWWDGHVDSHRITEAGFDPTIPRIQQLLQLVESLVGFPRHLSQHVGGFVISELPLSHLVPVENAAMPERTIIQWDKNDLEELGLLKVDVLGLGILSAIRRSFDLIEKFDGRKLSMANILEKEDSDVYAMIARADTIGAFQIESRAQMAMLPRLKPAKYYDLVIQVAIVRPGPIQGDMVHPYLRRRNKEEPVTYPTKAVEQVLERTLGVPIFQEQVMQLAIVAAGFTPGEADQLRRAMAAWGRGGDLESFEERLIQGMLARDYTREFAERIFNQIKGFGEYGFPESHAASFALLAYVSAWLKFYEPAVFFSALINSQPMGFYAPAQLIRCAREHAVEVNPVDVNHSDWDLTLEPGSDAAPAIRLGLRIMKGLSADGGERLVQARKAGKFASVQDLAERAALGAKDLGALAAAGALKSLTRHRHRARWEVAGVEKPTELLDRIRIAEGVPMLRRPSEGDDISADYRYLGLSLGRHPLALLRGHLSARRILSALDVSELNHGARVYTAGLVITRQRPASASGVTFVTLEDETGYVNLVVWDSLAQHSRKALLSSALLGVKGKVQKDGAVVHIIAERLYDHSELLGNLVTHSRDFH